MNSATSSSAPRFSIVIVTYNSLENIRACLESLRRCRDGGQAGRAQGAQEIIVVDNNSRDGTQAYLSAQADIRAVLNSGNEGFSKGCNQGAGFATGEYLVFLNPDTLVTPEWAGTMARHFRNSSVGAVGPVSNYVAGLQRLDMNLPPAWRDAKSFPGDGAVEVSDNLARILAEGNAGKGVETRLLIGFCLMMKRDLFLSMGGMDENLFLGNDDLDLSWRLRNLGRKLVVASDAFVFHEGQKSFRTESKSHVDRLTQESTDALYVKLVRHYGGRENLPSALDLWGIGWFSPSPSLLQGPLPGLEPTHLCEPEANVKNDARDQNAWNSVTTLVYLGPDASGSTDAAGAAARLERTLDGLPAVGDILVVNCSDLVAAPEAPAGATLRKLDLGRGIAPRQALEIALSLMPRAHILFCAAGVEFSALFNHWLDKRDAESIGVALPIPVRIGDGGETAPCASTALLCRKDWLRESLSSLPAGPDAGEFLAGLDRRLRMEPAKAGAGGKPVDPPWLSIRRSDLPPAGAPPTVATPAAAEAGAARKAPTLLDSLMKMGRSEASSSIGSNAKTEPTDLYPESLRPAMREAAYVGFAGTAADQPPLSGPFRAYDPKGDLVPVASRDLLIVRITPDMIDGLAGRLANIRASAPGLKKLIAVFNGADARGAAPANALPAIDLTPEGVRQALWRSGFAVTGEKPYRGFPEGAVQGSTGLEGWTQVEAVPRSPAHATEKKVSIVILGFNQVEYTRKCIESIRMHTRQKYELILVDNGSRDGTEAYFRSVPEAKVVRNAVNLGVSRGWNQGMRLAEGDYILILNNDVIVGPDWLENMVRLAESDPSIGMVGPRSNYIAGPQLVPDVPYKAESGIQEFIREWQAGHALSAAEFGFIKGFCHLIPRRVFEKVGFYDERYGKGNFEDDDYCLRVRYNGFRTLMADDSFIHHFGSVSFNQESVDWQALMVENRAKFEAKWAKGPAAVEETYLHEPEPAGSWTAVPAPQATEPLWKAEVENLIGSARYAPAMDILEKRFKRGEDPAACRNYLGLIAHACGDAEMALGHFQAAGKLAPYDADITFNLADTLLALGRGEEAARHLESMREGNGAGSGPEAQDAAAYAEQIRRAMEAGPISAERLLASRDANILGEQSLREGSPEKACEILEAALAADPGDFRALNNLGIAAWQRGDGESALGLFARCLEIRPAWADALVNAFDASLALDRMDGFTAILDRALAVSPAHPQALAMRSHIKSQGPVLTEYGSFEEMEAGSALLKRAEKAMEKGLQGEAILVFLEAVNLRPRNPQALNGLGIIAFGEKRYGDAFGLFEAAAGLHPLDQDILLNLWQTAQALRREGEVLPRLRNSLERDPALEEVKAVVNAYA